MSEQTDVTPQPLSPILTKIQFIVLNLESAQAHKGAFKMEDCKTFLNCVKSLVSLFTPTEDDSEKMAEQEDVDALATLTQLCAIQQSTGVFSINGSVMILDALEEINEALNAIKNPALKFKELQSKVKHGKSKK